MYVSEMIIDLVSIRSPVAFTETACLCSCCFTWRVGKFYQPLPGCCVWAPIGGGNVIDFDCAREWLP